MPSQAKGSRARNGGALRLASNFLATFPPTASLAMERKLARSPRVREQSLLAIQVEEDGKELVVRLDGELDIASAKAFEDEVRRAIDTDASSVTLDLSRLSFIDSTGLRAMLAINEFSSSKGDPLRMSRGSEPVERALEVSGLRDSLPFAS
jgi:anti-anti-sigma factor